MKKYIKIARSHDIGIQQPLLSFAFEVPNSSKPTNPGIHFPLVPEVDL